MSISLQHRIQNLIQLGSWLTEFLENRKMDDPLAQELLWIIEHHHETNPWFSSEQIQFALLYWSRHLQPTNLEKWTKPYLSLLKRSRRLHILVITAGNIPLAGFHDLVSVFLSGNLFYGSFSSKDNQLLPLLVRVLYSLDPACKNQIFLGVASPFTPDRVISAGSNNTSRYIEHTYRDVPQLNRRNRSSMAILMGNESKVDFENLVMDMTRYYGLGCRSVSKIFVQNPTHLAPLKKVLSDHLTLLQNSAYQNNLTFQKARYQLLDIQFIDAGPFLIIKNTELTSPVSVIHYEIFSDLSELIIRLNMNLEEIQCIVGQKGLIPGIVDFGKAQDPQLWDYADHVDTLNFLLQ